MTLRAGVLAVAAGLVASDALADWEVAVHGGPTFPFYEQSFAFDPGPIGGAAGTIISQEGLYRLDGRGGISLGAALAFHPHSVVGLEMRLDTADVAVEGEVVRPGVGGLWRPCDDALSFRDVDWVQK